MYLTEIRFEMQEAPKPYMGTNSISTWLPVIAAIKLTLQGVSRSDYEAIQHRLESYGLEVDSFVANQHLQLRLVDRQFIHEHTVAGGLYTPQRVNQFTEAVLALLQRCWESR